MEFCKIVIVPGLGQLAQLPLCDRDSQTVLQEAGISLKAGDMIHVDEDSAADQKKASVLLDWLCKDRECGIDGVFPAGNALYNRGMPGGG